MVFRDPTRPPFLDFDVDVDVEDDGLESCNEARFFILNYTSVSPARDRRNDEMKVVGLTSLGTLTAQS